MRPKAIQNLLNSVNFQTLYPNEIIVVDGSLNNETSIFLKNSNFKNLKYVLVYGNNRGLTRQRNYGINLVDKASEIICFLDDDIVLEPNYFEKLIGTYNIKQDALAVGGYIKNEVFWKQSNNTSNPNTFYYDGWVRSEPSRFKLRKKFGLQPDTAPGFLPTFSHGRSIGFFPPSGKIYEVELIMGGASSYKKEVFNTLKFSTYFEEREKIPFHVDLAFSKKLDKLPLKWHIVFENLQQWKLAFSNPSRSLVDLDGNETEENINVFNHFIRHIVLGAELFHGKAINLRFGYNFRRGEELKIEGNRVFAGLTAGFGVKLNKFRLNYAFQKYSAAANAHTFGLNINLQ